MARFRGTDGDDTYTLREGKPNVVRMLGGDDTVYLNATSFDSDDRIDGGTGSVDRVILEGSGFYNLGHNQLTAIEVLAMTGPGDFEVYIDDSVGQADRSLVVTAFYTGESDPTSVFIDGAAERDAFLSLGGSHGKDVLIGGGRSDTFYGYAGNDLMTGNEGTDSFVFVGDIDKGDRWGKDVITDFTLGEDRLIFAVDTVTAFDQLLITDGRDGAVVRTPGSKSSVTLLGVLAGDLDEGDVVVTNFGGHPILHAHAPAFAHDGPLA